MHNQHSQPLRPPSMRHHDINTISLKPASLRRYNSAFPLPTGVLRITCGLILQWSLAAAFRLSSICKWCRLTEVGFLAIFGFVENLPSLAVPGPCSFVCV